MLRVVRDGAMRSRNSRRISEEAAGGAGRGGPAPGSEVARPRGGIGVGVHRPLERDLGEPVEGRAPGGLAELLERRARVRGGEPDEGRARDASRKRASGIRSGYRPLTLPSQLP